MKTYKPSNDIQRLEWEKMKKRREELWNERDPRSSYWKPTHAQQFSRVALESTPTTPRKNTSLQSWEEYKLASEYGSRWHPSSNLQSRQYWDWWFKTRDSKFSYKKSYPTYHRLPLLETSCGYSILEGMVLNWQWRSYYRYASNWKTIEYSK